MKLNQFGSISPDSRVIQQFGNALLVQHQNGRHELVGGSFSDLIAASEWVSLFAHDIVFTAPGQPVTLGRKWMQPRMQPFSRS